MRHNVTTPSGFFVGLGGIAAFCAVATGVYSWVEKPASNSELLPQQKALGWVVEEDKKAERPKIAAFLEKAANEYNGGKKLNLNNIDDLRGVTRFRETHESNVAADALLTAKSTVEGKNVLQAAMAEVTKEIGTKKPAASAVKVDLLPPAADAPVSMPNFQGGGAKTVTFPAPLPAAPEPAKPQAAISQPTQAVAAAPAPNRPPLLNWSDLK